MYPRRLNDLSPPKITGIYLVFGFAWIVVTDWLVFMAVQSSETISLLQTLKGWIYVAISGALILGLTRLRQREVELAQGKLERASEQLQVFHRFLRHNIRNDLTVIHGNIREVEEELANAENHDRLKTARRTVEKIGERSEKVRAIDKIDLTHAPTDNEVELVELTRHEIDSIEDEYPEVTISLTAPDERTVRAEPSLRFAIYELLDNAITHNPKPVERCEIDVAIRDDHDGVTLVIEDNGPGIEDAELASLEAKEETDLMHMSGVGLWLATWLAEYFDGQLEVEGTPRTGTTARLHLDSETSRGSMGEIQDSSTRRWGIGLGSG